MSLPRPFVTPAAPRHLEPLEQRVLLTGSPSRLDADALAPLGATLRQRARPQAAAAQVTIADAAALEGADGATTTFTFTLRRRGSAAALSRFTRVAYATAQTGAAHQATSDTDFTAASGTLFFRPGEKIKRLTIDIPGDDDQEGAESFFLNLSNPRAGVLLDNQATGTIVDDDVPLLSIDDATLAEGDAGDTTFTFTVTLSEAAAAEVTVDFATADGTAVGGSDYGIAGGTLTFDAGDLTKTIAVEATGDTSAEATETFLVRLSNPSFARLGDAAGVGTITDDDRPALSIADDDLVEGDSGAASLHFVVTLDNAPAVPVTVRYRTVDGTGIGGDDFIAKSGTLTFNLGETTKSIFVPVPGDTKVESNKQLTVLLTRPTNAVITDAAATGTIYENEPVPTVSVADATVTEGSAAAVVVTLSGASDETVVVRFATESDEAQAGDDFTDTIGAVTFRPGQTTRTALIPTLADTVDEGDEDFTVTVLSVTNAGLTDGEATVTIEDDTDPPTISVADVTVAEDDGPAAFTVTLSGASTQTITVAYATADGTAEDENGDDDYTAATGTVTFAPGETSQTVDVTITDDGRFESAEAFTLQLSNPVNATLADEEASATITSDDARPRFSVNNATAAEGDAGATAFTFTVTAVGELGEDITINYTTLAGTATPGSDFTPRTGSVTFAPGDDTKTFTINVLGDGNAEANETFFVQLALATAGTGIITDGIGQGLITNDD